MVRRPNVKGRPDRRSYRSRGVPTRRAGARRPLQGNNQLGQYTGTVAKTAGGIALLDGSVKALNTYFRAKRAREQYESYNPYPPAPNRPRRPAYPPTRPPVPGHPKPPTPAQHSRNRLNRAFVRPDSQATQLVPGKLMVLNMTPKYKERFYKAFASTKQTMSRLSTFKLESPVGKQNSVCVSLMDSHTTQIIPAATPPIVDKELNNMFLVGSVLQQGSMQDVKRQQIYVDSMSTNFRIVNSTNSPNTLVVRLIRPRNKTSTLPDSMWQQACLLDDNYDTAAETTIGWPPYNTANKIDVPYNSPKQQKTFREHYHVTHQKLYHMGPGSETELNVIQQYFKTCKAVDIWNPGFLSEDAPIADNISPQNQTFHPKWTVFVMFTLLGPKMQTTDDIMTYSEGQISVYQKTTYRFYNYPYRPVGTYLLNEISTTPTAAQLFAFDDDEGDANTVKKL